MITSYKLGPKTLILEIHTEDEFNGTKRANLILTGIGELFANMLLDFVDKNRHSDKEFLKLVWNDMGLDIFDKLDHTLDKISNAQSSHAN